jgi:hypothetical protein
LPTNQIRGRRREGELRRERPHNPIEIRRASNHGRRDPIRGGHTAKITNCQMLQMNHQWVLKPDMVKNNGTRTTDTEAPTNSITTIPILIL